MNGRKEAREKGSRIAGGAFGSGLSALDYDFSEWPVSLVLAHAGIVYSSRRTTNSTLRHVLAHSRIDEQVYPSSASASA